MTKPVTSICTSCNADVPIAADVSAIYLKEHWQNLTSILPKIRNYSVIPEDEKGIIEIFNCIHEHVREVKNTYPFPSPLLWETMQHSSLYCINLIHEELKWLRNVEIKNFYQINECIYRGGALTQESLFKLKKFGIKTIVSLTETQDIIRFEGSEQFTCIHFPFSPYTPPSEYSEKIQKFISILTQKETFPIYFHCQHGVDRTGFLCAAYRILVENWKKEDAIKEMEKFQTMNAFFFKRYKDYILNSIL